MNKLARIIDELDEQELRLVKQDLDAGNIDKLISRKIMEKAESDQNKVCPTCHNPVNDESITIIFGPKDFRKKASFCAIDCLEYFIGRIKVRAHERNE